jgi:microcystin-dependent protein
MPDPFLAEIKLVGFNFAPRGWALCDGQILPINQNQALFSLLGTTYGGDGRTSFALPDLRGRVPVHPEIGNILLGQSTGSESTILLEAEMPQHRHAAWASAAQGESNQPVDRLLAADPGGAYKRDPTGRVVLHAGIVGRTGGNGAHNNMMPFGVLNFVIALQGVFPSRN